MLVMGFEFLFLFWTLLKKKMQFVEKALDSVKKRQI